jgi:SAM-dependent methyltransferase
MERTRKSRAANAQRDDELRASSFDDRSYGKWAHLYDLLDLKENIEFFYHYASPAGEILDIGAGTGRIAIPLAERGLDVWYVEPSPAMRREFENKLSQRPDLTDRIHLIGGDAETFDIDRTFQVAFLSGVFDHFLDDDERIQSLRNIGRHLSPDGIVIFDVFLGLMEDQPLKPAGVAKLDDREIRRYVGGNILPDKKNRKKRVELVFEVCHGGTIIERIVEQGLVGITSREDVHRVLKSAGFEVRGEWSDYDFSPYRDEDSLLLVAAAKCR